MSQIILHLTDANFNEIIVDSVNSEKKWFLVDFWAEWCNPCKLIAPILEEISVEFNDKLIVSKLNIDDSRIIAKKYNIRSIPTLLLIHNGVVVSNRVGVLSKQQLRDFLNENIQ